VHFLLKIIPTSSLKNKEFWFTIKRIQDRATLSSIGPKFDLQEFQVRKKYINQQRIGFQIWLNLKIMIGFVFV
jgi:hypothetical protein